MATARSALRTKEETKVARRKADPAPSDSESLSFENALSNLEAIIEAMEHEHLPLEDLVSHYEKGSALLARCEAVLNSAKDRIKLITLKNQNEIGLEGEDKRDEPSETSGLNDPDDDDNDIRLF